jgi:hypothetical protein
LPTTSIAAERYRYLACHTGGSFPRSDPPGGRRGLRQGRGPQAPTSPRARTLPTLTCVQRPPFAVFTPRSFSAWAMALRNVMPCACSSRMIGRTFAANCPAAALRDATMRYSASPGGGLSRCVHLALVLGNGCQDMDGQLVGVRVMDRRNEAPGIVRDFAC